jgi:hypothetical protein
MPYENDPYKFPVYTNISQATASQVAFKMGGTIKGAPKGLFPADLQCNRVVICEIINKVQMRKVYFRVYYNCDMSEINEVALYCFWIIKFVPFYAQKQSTIELNVKIAMYIFLKTLSYCATKQGKKLNVNEKMLKDIYYSFKNRDLSKEAIMLIAETLTI